MYVVGERGRRKRQRKTKLIEFYYTG